MKHPKLMLIIGIWFFFVPLLGIPSGFIRIFIVLPAIVVIALAIASIRSTNNNNNFSASKEELVQELAEEIADEIIDDANKKTEQEIRHLRDIL
jgi:hypothetical protein